MADHSDHGDLQVTKEHTARIFYQYVKLQSEALGDETRESSTRSESVEQAGATKAAPVFTRSKSRDASKKETHPKAVHSVTPLPPPRPVQRAASHHCKAGANTESSQIEDSFEIIPSPHETKANGNSVSSLTSSSPSSGKPRPEKLSLERKIPRNSTDSSGKATSYVQDPPMDSEIANSYPPMSSVEQQLRGAAGANATREGLVRSAVHARSVAEPSSCQATCGRSVLHDGLRHSQCTVSVEVDRQAKLIADRLKTIGDDLHYEYVETKFEDLTGAIRDMVADNPTNIISLLQEESKLSWEKVAQFFSVFYKFLAIHKYDDQQFSVFEKVWYCMLDNIVPLIQSNGGWSAFQRETDPHGNTPTAVRHHSQMYPSKSEPALFDEATPTRQRLQSFDLRCHNRGGRMAYTPQMQRHAFHDQSSPCLSRSHTQPSQDSSSFRQRNLWSLTDSGTFKNEEGTEDIERSISELDITESCTEFKEEEDEESDAFTSQEDDEEERQTVECTLTSSSLRSSLPSPPIAVPSPHSSSQPETTSIDELTFDSGYENTSLSLSSSPLQVSFIVGGVRHSSRMPYQTSLTSLSSTMSASPVHTSPCSRKNSSSNGNGGCGYSNLKPRPRSSGSVKEPHSRNSVDSTGQCSRSGSLTRRRPPVTTPTSVGSDHASLMDSPIAVRRMSTSATAIYERVKCFFRSP